MKILRNVVFIGIYFLMVCVGQANENIMKKTDFQNSVYNLVSPFFAGNYQNYTVNGTSFEQSYNNWKNRITNEYKILRKQKIGEYNSLQQYLDEATQKEKLYRAPAILVFSDGTGEPYSDKYSVVDDFYVHRYILCHTFKSYQCSHRSLEDLKNHMYWINQCNQRCTNLWNKLENGPEIVEYYHDISADKKNKVIEMVLESDGSDPVYDNLNMSDFYREKLAELNKLVLPYKKALQTKDTKAKSEILNDFISKIKSVKCAKVLEQKTYDFVLIGYQHDITCFKKFKNCNLKLYTDPVNSLRTVIACSCGHPLSLHKFKFKKGVNEHDMMKIIQNNS